MGDLRQITDREIAYELIGAIGQLFAERGVFFAPEHERRRVEWRRRGKIIGRIGDADSGAVIIDHRRHGARDERVFAIFVEDCGRKAVLVDGHFVEGVGHHLRIAHGEELFRQPRDLEEEDIPGLFELGPGADAFEEERRVGQVHHDEPLQWTHLTKREGPTNGPAPIMGNEGDGPLDATVAGSVDEAPHICQKKRHGVICDADGPRRLAIAPQIGRPCRVAKFGQQRHLRAP